LREALALFIAIGSRQWRKPSCTECSA